MNIHHLFYELTMIPKRIKWFIQRGRRGYSTCDTWDVGEYLFTVLPPMLRQLAKDTHGCPREFYDDTPSGEGIECHLWSKEITRIADDLDRAHALQEDFSGGYTEHGKEAQALIERAFTDLGKNLNALWD